jgi:adenylate kinase
VYYGLNKGYIIDHHDPSLFPERWIDLAVVLVCDNSVLYDRLTARYVIAMALRSRNYPANKVTENITAEIMQTVLTDTRESYAEEIIVELHSDGRGGDNEVEENVRRIIEWVKQWRLDLES